jgi:hypothetical protein
MTTDALGRTVSVLDAAADGSNPTGNTDRPLGYEAPSRRKKTPRELELEAERVRAELRADTERRKRENKIAAENAQREQAAAAERGQKAALEKANSWEEQMKAYRPASEVNLTEPLLSVIINRCGLAEGIRSRASKVQSHLDAWDAAFEARQKTAYSEFKRQLLEDMAYNEDMLKAGVTDLRTLPDEDRFMKQAATTRAMCKARQQTAADAVNPLLFEIADDLQKAARKLAVDTLIAEKKTASEFGVEFEPSCVLRALVSAGYGLRRLTEYNFRCTAMVCPRDTMFGILDVKKEWR